MEQTMTQITEVLWGLDPSDTMAFLSGLVGKLFETPLILKDSITESWIKHAWVITLSSQNPHPIYGPGHSFSTIRWDRTDEDLPSTWYKNPQLQVLNLCLTSFLAFRFLQWHRYSYQSKVLEQPTPGPFSMAMALYHQTQISGLAHLVSVPY